MSKIRILPEILSNKIAAGEVVERPSSVVKELVENAIDAKSKKIIIEIEKGGRSLIRVSDNGIGMNRDDALLSLERYATSKIFEDRDLFSIKTLGFRGEALPSIASICRFSMVTRDKASESGTGILIEGGKIKKVSETGAPIGTMISVQNLFYNTPARRKFLKTVNTEMGHIADVISSTALGWPNVQFRLIHNKRIVKNWPPVLERFERVADVLGSDLKNELHQIKFDDGYFSISGWISSPLVARSTSQKIYLYVNGRFVKAKGIMHAIFEGYQGRLMKGRFPVAVIFIRLPFDRLDVNVHPAKQEIRFADHKRVYEALKTAVSRIWYSVERPKWAATNQPGPFEKKPDISNSLFDDSTPDCVADHLPADGLDYIRTEDSMPLSTGKNDADDRRKETAKAEGSVSEKTCISEPLPLYNRTGKEQLFPAEKENPDTPVTQKTIWEKKLFADLKIIGQFHDTYILCESDEGLILIDQHAAHERILFEQLKVKSDNPKKRVQNLLIPETIETGYKEAVMLEKMIPDFKELGLEVEPFGGNTFVVKSVPDLLAGKEVKPLIMEIIEKMGEIEFTPGLEKAIEECLILISCHSAIRANQPLSGQQMKALLLQLDECDNPSYCPHGRPTWMRCPLTFFEKSFKRIV